MVAQFLVLNVALQAKSSLLLSYATCWAQNVSKTCGTRHLRQYFGANCAEFWRNYISKFAPLFSKLFPKLCCAVDHPCTLLV